ncbi:MAG TPA: ABC transporter permease, partial [Bacteroidota bacterium]|nr:ABC transporter permease [Bacteroidota bacterium]
MKTVEWFIANRLLRSKRSVRFINVIGYISIIGITVGVAALLIALSVFNGFSSVVTSVLVGFDPHIRIEKRGVLTSNEIDSVETLLRGIPTIQATSPFVSGKAMLIARGFNRVVYVRGVDQQRIGKVTGLQSNIVLGSLDLSDSTDVGGMIIGLTLADRLSTVIGDEISVISPQGFQSSTAGMVAPSMTRFKVSGIFESNNKEYDANYAYVSLHSAQQLYQMEGTFNGIELRLDDFNMAEGVKEDISKQLTSEFSVSTWYDLHKNLYSVMKIERWIAYILLSLIIVVAMFNMLGSLTMGVIEKKRDIGVMKTMGMTSKNIVRVFLFEGLFIGIIGTFLGIIIGLVVLYLHMKYHLFPLDPTVYIIPAIPVEIH